MRESIQSLAQECYDRARAGSRPTREVARELVAEASPSLVATLAVEYLVGVVASAQRADTREAERASEVRPTASLYESPQSTGRIPRKGSQARADWERNTEEGRAWAEAEEAAEIRRWQMTLGVLGKALERYAEDLHIKWTAELLDSSFALRDGSVISWGDASIEQHRERRQMFLDNAHVNMEGAARHEVAIRELEASGTDTLRALVGASA